MVRNEPATGHMKIATSNGPIDEAFLRAMTNEKELRLEAAGFIGASFPLTNFPAELDRASTSCRQH